MRQIVINCYKFHNREDLLPAFLEDDEKNEKDGQTAPKEKVKMRSHQTVSLGGSLTTNVATVTSLGDPNSALAQTVNVTTSLTNLIAVFGHFSPSFISFLFNSE